MFVEYLGELKDKEGRPIPIIFRPWHENNQRRFWWAVRGDGQDFIKLWRFTVEYLRDAKPALRLHTACPGLGEEHFHHGQVRLSRRRIRGHHRHRQLHRAGRFNRGQRQARRRNRRVSRKDRRSDGGRPRQRPAERQGDTLLHGTPLGTFEKRPSSRQDCVCFGLAQFQHGTFLDPAPKSPRRRRSEKVPAGFVGGIRGRSARRL